MLFAPQKLIDRSNQIKIHEGKTLVERASSFTGYCVEVSSLEDIQAAYYKLRKMHGKATHIACSYRLTECAGPFNQDAIDDAEHGSGRSMLNYLKKNQLLNTAVFMVRYYGGAKIGPYRFQLINEVIKDAYEQMINTSFEEQA